jgi:hypothetical protein
MAAKAISGALMFWDNIFILYAKQAEANKNIKKKIARQHRFCKQQGLDLLLPDSRSHHPSQAAGKNASGSTPAGPTALLKFTV